MEPHQDTTVEVEGNERIRSSSASSTSSTSSSEFQDPQLNSFKKENVQKRNSNVEKEKDEQESSLQSPPIQTMERPPTNNGSGYRIPSYVFARNKSGNLVEWSTTSNESLFSIQTGNSFTADKYSWLLEAADMYNVPDQEDSPQTQEISTPQVSSSPTDEVIESVPEKQMDNVHTSDGGKHKPLIVEDQATPASSRSNESSHSFAFPFPLAEQQGERAESVKSGKSVKSGLSSVPEQQKESPSSAESNEEPSPPPPAPEPAAYTSLICSWYAACMACFRCRMKTTTADKEAAAAASASANKN